MIQNQTRHWSTSTATGKMPSHGDAFGGSFQKTPIAVKIAVFSVRKNVFASHGGHSPGQPSPLQLVLVHHEMDVGARRVGFLIPQRVADVGSIRR